jgi:POT family proton-dependent oligopeptide transporter
MLSNFFNKTLNHPKSLYLLIFVQMWEHFSYYGMRALLVLFMTQQLLYGDAHAYGVNSSYTAFVEISCLLGGFLADRYLGMQRSIFWGASLIVLGHICLTLSYIPVCFFLGLGLIVCGTGFFRPSCTNLLGSFYGSDDPRRDEAYVFFYAGINIGSFLATTSCAITAQIYGWHIGFGLAAIGMGIALAFLSFKRHLLQNMGAKAPEPKKVPIIQLLTLPAVLIVAFLIANHRVAFSILPVLYIAAGLFVYIRVRHSDAVKPFCILFIFMLYLATFFAFEEQFASTLMLFSERHVHRHALGFEWPSPVLASINPIVIMFMGPLIGHALLSWEKKHNLQASHKVSFAFVLMGIAFALLYINCQHEFPLGIAMMAFATIGLSELFMTPTIYALSSKLSPREFAAMAMGMVMMGFSIANTMGGHIAQFFATESNTPIEASLDLYRFEFLAIMIFCFIMAGVVLIVNKFVLSKLFAEIEPQI